MSPDDKRKNLIEQVSYALSVQILVEQKVIADPEPGISQKQRQATNHEAEHAVEEFERASLVAEVRKISIGPGFWYGIFQGVFSAFIYSIILVIVAFIVKENGIDIISALTKPN